jgi:SAM-dependent methyltransferase
MYTDLPVTNGLFFFIAKILADVLEVGETHSENSGCLNDFLSDKRGVDVGMRAAFICGRCRTNYAGKLELLRDIENILNLLSNASRSSKDVLSIEPISISPKDISFDVFLCHNSDDKELIREINKALQSGGVVTWLDEEQLRPGQLWQAELEKQIGKIRNACVFVGKNNRGPWQDFEIRAFLNEFVNRGGAVIPVILPDASEIPDLPIFLKQMMWVDLRKDYDKSLLKLIGAFHSQASA